MARVYRKGVSDYERRLSYRKRIYKHTSELVLEGVKEKLVYIWKRVNKIIL